MIRKDFISKLFEGFSIKRWNDQIKPAEFVEMDKNAHKMAIAYCLAQYEREQGKSIDWHNIIRGGIFELLKRIPMSDIKSQIYRKICSEPRAIKDINNYVYGKLESLIANDSIKKEFQEYLMDNMDNKYIDPLSQKILSAAHRYASFWEFRIIRNANPNSSQMQETDQMMYDDLEPYMDLIGIQKLLGNRPVSKFIDLVGRLRFQTRWSQTPRIPSTSVLGHSMMVAVLSYMLSRELPGCCDARIRNNFFGGLFHDIPEALTRDIIRPVKENFPKEIKNIERELMKEELYPLLPTTWHSDFKYLVENEFESKVITNGHMEMKSSDEINKSYNDDRFEPYDGEIIKVCDDLSAFVEAFKSCEIGICTDPLKKCITKYKDQYIRSDKRTIAGIDIGSIYQEF
jgi:putative hydrolase of HD superfamily